MSQLPVTRAREGGAFGGFLHHFPLRNPDHIYVNRLVVILRVALV